VSRFVGPDQNSGAGVTSAPPTHHFARAQFGKRGRRTAEALRSKALKTERTTSMNAVALVVAWLAVVTLVLIARSDYRARKPIR
jgi:hypothetical protein